MLYIEETYEKYALGFTCKYLNCSAEEESAITSDASRKALLAFCSPSAAITYGWQIVISINI